MRLKGKGRELLALVTHQTLRRNDGISVNIRLHHRRSRTRDLREFLHGHDPSLRGSAICPAIAAAAAMAGLARWVRAFGPCRPTKLRFVVDTERWPGGTMSPLMPAHIEQPALRHSKPALKKILSNPSRSAARCVASEPGTIQARTLGATFRPAATRAASRMSDNRPFVQEPTNTQSTGVPSIASPGLRPMYDSAASIAWRRWGSVSRAGSGMR